MRLHEYILIGGGDHGFIFDERDQGSRPLDGNVIFWRKNNIRSDIYCSYNHSIFIFSPQYSYEVGMD